MRAAIILAAGQGTRMKSAKPKVLHELLGKPMLRWVVEAARAGGAERIILVVGHGAAAVRDEFAPDEDVVFALQEQQLGTGDAVRAGLAALPEGIASVWVLCGDVPLLPASALDALAAAQQGAGLSVLTFETPPPHAYGRIVRSGDQVCAIVEAADASPEQLTIAECNSGTYCFSAEFLGAALPRLEGGNAQGELYLTDLVAIAAADGVGAVAVVAEDASLLTGVNDRAGLAALAQRAQAQINAAHMAAGVTFEDPASIWVDSGVCIGHDTVLEPGVRLRGETLIGSGCAIAQGVIISDSVVGDGVVIKPYSVLESARVEAGCIVGPFARLRPEAHLETGARVGNFVEIKKARLGAGAKANHLAYIGDAEVGAGANIGAGTITCNYDGAAKHRTEIGASSFIGSNTTLVAPVVVGEGAYVGAGSVITQEVPSGALGVGRGRQRNIEGWVERSAPKKDG